MLIFKVMASTFSWQDHCWVNSSRENTICIPSAIGRNLFWTSIWPMSIIKVEKNLSLDLITAPSVKIQNIGGKVYLRFKGKVLLGIVNKLSLDTSHFFWSEHSVSKTKHFLPKYSVYYWHKCFHMNYSLNSKHWFLNYKPGSCNENRYSLCSHFHWENLF